MFHLHNFYQVLVKFTDKLINMLGQSSHVAEVMTTADKRVFFFIINNIR